MKIYKLKYSENCKNIYPCEEQNLDFYQMFDGTSYKTTWKSMNVKYIDEEAELEKGNNSYFSIPVFDKVALDVLQKLMGEDVEILPLMLDNEEVYGINVLSVLKALDYDNSEYRTFTDGEIMVILKYSFIEKCISNKNIFKITDESRTSSPFVSELFKKTVEDNNLTGFEFELVWDSEEKTKRYLGL